MNDQIQPIEQKREKLRALLLKEFNEAATEKPKHKPSSDLPKRESSRVRFLSKSGNAYDPKDNISYMPAMKRKLRGCEKK
ncbi:MAG: hypothetical protein PHC39_04610 [Proteiniphilum sp.]|nr:hypothetical protein [Proteiniphilum sp.]